MIAGVMFSVQAPWDSAEVLLICPHRETALIPTLTGKNMEIEVLQFVRHIRVGGKLLDLDAAKALISALMSQVTYLEQMP